MSKDVIITPASGLIDFQNSGNTEASIQLDSNGNLNFVSANGDISIGDTTSDVYIGDGVNNVDIVFEQNGAIRALATKTLTLGQSNSFINVNSQTTFTQNVTAPYYFGDGSNLTNIAAGGGGNVQVSASPPANPSVGDVWIDNDGRYLTYFSDGDSFQWVEIAASSGNVLAYIASTTDSIAEGTNLYFTETRANSAIDNRVTKSFVDNLNILEDLTTANVVETTNLYYTETRANTAIDNRVTKSFVDNLNVNADTLDGIDSASFLRSNDNDTASGNIVFSGLVTHSGNEVLSSNGVIQRFTNLYSFDNYLTSGEFQKILTIIPNGASQNYSVLGKITAQSGAVSQVIDFQLHLRSNTLPDLDWQIIYDEDLNGINTPYVKPVLWVKETTTAGVILALEHLNGSVQNINVDIVVLNRSSTYKNNVFIFNGLEVSSVDSGYTSYDFVLRQRRNKDSYVNFLGNLKANSYITVGSNLGTFSGAVTVDLNDGNYFYGTAGNVTTWTFAGHTTSGDASGFILEITNGGAYTQTWPNSVEWASNTAPTLTAAGKDLLVFVTRDGGTTYLGLVSAQDLS